MTPDPTTSVRLTSARQRVADAISALESARAAADEARGDRARWGGRTQVIAAATAAVVSVILVVASIVLMTIAGAGQDDTDRAADVLTAARAGITTALTADPTRSEQYVTAVLAVSTGEFRQRITDSAREIESSVASQPFPGTGQVVAAGIVGTDPGSTASGVDVLVVAEATNPQLLGGGAGDARVVLIVRMAHAAGAWKIERAQLQ